MSIKAAAADASGKLGERWRLGNWARLAVHSAQHEVHDRHSQRLDGRERGVNHPLHKRSSERPEFPGNRDDQDAHQGDREQIASATRNTAHP
jgi:hypothetical protein